tara:strand:- start:45646 stop:47121 length:1476 start_codon:yes stop_codon:yes gene_type:complete
MSLSTAQFRDRKLAIQWIAAGHSLTRLPQGSGANSGGMPMWIPDLLAEHGSLPPVGVVTDIGQLFAGRSLRETAPLPAVSPRLRSALRSYEDHVLGRLGASPVFETIRDTYCSLSPELQGRATTILIQRFLGRIGFESGASVSLGLVRNLVRAPKEETMHSGLEALSESGIVVDAIAEAFEELTQKARRCSALLDGADVFLVENVEVLGELTQRLFIEQLAEVEARFRAGLPKRLKARRKPLQGKVSTSLAAEEEYPAGGFSSISTSGSLENLVISELIYMEDDAASAEQNVDLFDLRYAEGELLYYTRDDAVFLRDHRVIQFVFEPSLVHARTKDEHMSWQRLVVALGLVACAIERLSDWLGDSGLLIRLAFVEDEGRSPLDSERGVLSLLAKDWIERGMVEVTSAESYEALLPELEEFAKGAEIDLISIGCGPRNITATPDTYQVAHLDLGSSRPTLSWKHRAEEDGVVVDDAWTAWQGMAMRLFAELV